MRAQRSGTIVNISSIGGKVYTPLGGWYHASKFALEALSDSLRMEVKQFGIDVVIIEPGGIASEWGGITADNLAKASSTGPYAAQAQAVANQLVAPATERRNSPPRVVADAIAKAVSARRPKTRYSVGFGAKPILLARWVLPDRAFDFVIARATGLPRK